MSLYILSKRYYLGFSVGLVTESLAKYPGSLNFFTSFNTAMIWCRIHFVIGLPLEYLLLKFIHIIFDVLSMQGYFVTINFFLTGVIY